MVSLTEESEMLYCFLLVKADRILDYCKKSPAEPVLCGIKKMKTGVFGGKKKNLMHTHTNKQKKYTRIL